MSLAISFLLSTALSLLPAFPLPPVGPNLPGQERTQPAPPTLVERIAARAVGEADVIGGEGVRLVACTIINRLRSNIYPNDLGLVLRSYYAPDQQPTPAQLAIVQAAWDGECPPLFYAFSRQDVAKLGFNPDSANRVLRRGSWSLFFWAQWPASKEQTDAIQNKG